VAGFKSAAVKRINQIRRTPGVPIWQRSFYEHVIRNLKSLYRIRQYIAENPQNWSSDDDNPINIRPRDVGAHGGAPLKHQRSLNA
jgi:putative transposase